MQVPLFFRVCVAFSVTIKNCVLQKVVVENIRRLAFFFATVAKSVRFNNSQKCLPSKNPGEISRCDRSLSTNFSKFSSLFQLSCNGFHVFSLTIQMQRLRNLMSTAMYKSAHTL